MQRRKQDQWQQGGDRNRHRFTDPENGHEHGDAGGMPPGNRKTGRGGQEQGGDQANGPEHGSHSLPQAVLGGLGDGLADHGGMVVVGILGRRHAGVGYIQSGRTEDNAQAQPCWPRFVLLGLINKAGATNHDLVKQDSVVNLAYV